MASAHEFGQVSALKENLGIGLSSNLAPLQNDMREQKAKKRSKKKQVLIAFQVFGSFDVSTFLHTIGSSSLYSQSQNWHFNGARLS